MILGLVPGSVLRAISQRLLTFNPGKFVPGTHPKLFTFSPVPEISLKISIAQPQQWFKMLRAHFSCGDSDSISAPWIA